MFEDDDDFEIDEEFLDGVFDAEKSAIRSDISLEVSRTSPEKSVICDLESSPPRKRKLSQSNAAISEYQKALGPPLRTNEESARLVASAVPKSPPSNGFLWACEFDFESEEGNQETSASRYEQRTASNSKNSDCFKVPSSKTATHCDTFFTTTSAPSTSRTVHPDNVSFTLNTSRIRQRKFPGPAGLLPDRGQRSNLSSLMNISGSDLEEPEENLCSQSSASVLEDGPWSALQSDLANEGQGLLRRYTVAWVKQKAAARQLVGQKVPFLATVLHSIDCSSPDPCVVLRDATGEIPGTLHRSVWDSFGGQLISGSALVLRLVGVLSTGVSARRHYLNITSNNIVTIYSSPLCETSVTDRTTRTVRKTDVHKWTLNQLLQAVNNWEDQSKRKKESVACPISGQRNMGTFPPSIPSSSTSNHGSHSLPVRQPMQNTNHRTNIASGLTNDSISSVRSPAVALSKSSFSNISSVKSNSIANLSSQSSVTDPLRLHNSMQSTGSNAPGVTSSKFVLRKPTVSAGVPDTSKVTSQENARASNDFQSSRDLFSDADDLDISSVLDGIDSELLFGDF